MILDYSRLYPEQIQASKSRVLSLQNSVQSVGTVMSFRVDDGKRRGDFTLKYQASANTIFGAIPVNVWVETQVFESLSDNNLNTISHSDQTSRLLDRQTVVNEIGDTLRDMIVPRVVEAFGEIQAVSGSASDGLNVLVYDISDQFAYSGEFVGGFFDPHDKFDPNGNRINSIHMDTYPSNPGGNSTMLKMQNTLTPALPRKDFYHVLAHEIQHLIHAQFDNNETIWVNEGFSQLAIYRVFHQQKFKNGEMILNSPNDEAAQTGWWLKDPSSSLLMSTDEPQLTNKYYYSRSDSTELRGLGYLFFTYLWEKLGGKIVSGNALDGSRADSLVREMVKSQSRGLASIQSGLNTQTLNFNDIFDAFVLSLIMDGMNSLYTMEFFDYHGLLHYPLSSQLYINSAFAPRVYELAEYDFEYIPLKGAEAANLRLESPVSFNSFVIKGNSVKNRVLSQVNTGTTHTVFIGKDEDLILAISNPSFSSLSVELSWLSTMSLSDQSLPVRVISADLGPSVALDLDPMTIPSGSILKQKITNNTTSNLDILNNKIEKVAISACVANSNCISSSKIRVSRLASTAKAINIGGTDWTYSNLQLAPGSWDIYYANKDILSQSQEFMPKLTQSAISYAISNPLPVIPEDTVKNAGAGAGCFLASASFLGKDSFEVKLLSEFRDSFLLKKSWGREFVSFYYHYSPPLADWLSKKPAIGFLFQVFLMPLLLIAMLISAPGWLILFVLLVYLINSPSLKFFSRQV